MLSDKSAYYEVVFNTNLDVPEGIDLLLVGLDANVTVNLYTKTTRAFTGREKKGKRHAQYDNIEYVELPVEFNGSMKIGDFFLYGDREIIQLVNEINRIVK